MEEHKHVTLPGDVEMAALAAEAAAALSKGKRERSIELEPDLEEEDLPKVQVARRKIPGDFEEAAQGGSAEAELLDEPGSVDDEVAQAHRERDEYLDALRRLQADFENYRKRVQRQGDEQAGREAERLVSQLLPALDAFELAEEHLAGDEAVSPSGLLQAALLLRDTLVKAGLDKLGDVGEPFDPNAHEAVEHTEVDEGEGDNDQGPVVGKVLRPGYRWRGRVVRPAMVSVKG